VIKHQARYIVLLLAAGMLAACAQAGRAPGEPMSEGPVYINQMELQIMESDPIQVAVYLEGELPTPCHQLQWRVGEPSSDGQIELEVYSTAPADVACIQVLEPFEQSIALGSFEGGRYTVIVNAEQVGSFDA